MIKSLRMLAAGLALLGGLAQAAPLAVYDNTSTDTFNSVFFSTGPYTQIGDQVQLSAASALSSLQTQVYNNGDAAVLDATLSFYDAGSLAQIGASFTVSGISIASGVSQNLLFANLGGLAVPVDLIVMVAVQLVSGSGDIGLNLFDAPTLGSSDNSFFYTGTGAGLLQESSFVDVDNLYLLINAEVASGVAEPTTAWLVLASVAALAAASRRRRRAHAA